MKKTNYLVLLITLIFAASCEMQNELTGFEDGDGNPWQEPVDLPVPIGGGGGNGGNPSDDPNTPTPIGTEIRTIPVCIEKESLTVFTVDEAYGTNITWSYKGNWVYASKHGNKLSVYADESFSGGEVKAEIPNSLELTYNITACPVATPCFGSAYATIMDEHISDAPNGSNKVFLRIASNGWASTTTYALTTIREDGTEANYGASTSLIRAVTSSYDNPIQKVIITAKDGDCEGAFIVTLDTPIPTEGYTSNGVYFGWKKFLKSAKFFNK